ncbi:MAG: hypothetical protein RL123_1752, partial [Pseudomonadota bacterium]
LEAYSAAFPARRIAHAVIHTRDGRRLESAPTEARGDPEAMVSDAEMRAKYHRFADPVLGAARAAALEAEAARIGPGVSAAPLIDLIAAPVG